jgi:hypothetical protein
MDRKNGVGVWTRRLQTADVGNPRSVLATSEVIPSRAVRALEGEGRGLSHLEVAARGGCDAG